MTTRVDLLEVNNANVQKAYIAYFGRPADPSGLSFWTTGGTKATTMLTIMRDFGNSTEFTTQYAGLTNAAFVNRVFNNVFGRNADPDGLLFYANALTAGTITRADVVFNILNGASGTDKAIVDNKVTFSTSYTTELAKNVLANVNYDSTFGVPAARDALSKITATSTPAEITASVTSNITAVAAGPVDPSKTMTLTTGLDSGSAFAGGTGADTYIVGTTLHLQNFDSINGGSGTDTMLFSENGTTAITDEQFTNVDSVEALRLTGSSTYAVNLAAEASGAGISTVTVSGAAKTINLTGFKTAVAITSTAADSAGVEVADTVTVSLADAGTKTLSLGTGSALDVVNVTTVSGSTAGSVEVALTGSKVGDGTADNVTVGTRLVTEDESIKIVGGSSVFKVLDSATSRGNFSIVQLGSSSADAVTVASADANTYLNTGAGADTITAAATGTGRHFVDGGAGADVISVSVDAATASVLVMGGAGNDAVSVTGSTDGYMNVDLGDGDDTVVFTDTTFTRATAATSDTLAGGAGRDTLEALSASLAVAASTVTGAVSGFEALTVRDALAANLTTGNIQAGIDTVTLKAGTGGNTVSFDKTTNATLNLPVNSLAITVSLAADSTVAATSNSLTIANTSTSAASTLNAAINVTGFETVTLSGGATTVAGAQTIGAVTVNPDVSSSAVTVNFTGANAITAGVVSASTVGGSLTIDATNAASISLAAPGRAATVIGSAGRDSILGSTGSDSISAAAGNDTVDAGTGNDTIDGGAGDDVLSGGDGNDVIAGGDGADSIIGGNGNDSMTGGAGNDTFSGFAAGDSVDGGDGTDTLQIATSISSDTVLAAVSNIEVINLTAAGNTLTLGANASNAFTAGANASITGGGAGDVISAGSFTRAISVTLTGSGHTVTGGAGNDTVTLSTGADSITLGAGDDLVAAGSISASDDTIAGGAGTDTLTLSRTSGSATSFTPTGSNFSGFEVISLGGGLAAGTAVGAVADYTITLANADSTEGTISVDGSALQTGVVTAFGADGVLGGTDDTTSFGTLTLTSSSFFGAVSVVSGGGNDVISTGSKADTIDSGAGNDNISAGNGANVVTAGAGNDTVTSGTGNDTISGGDGNDSISSSDGADSIDGGAGADTIDGGAGNDVIIGGDGNDRLTGGSGADNLDGGAGNDTFVFTVTDFNNDNDTIVGGAGTNTVELTSASSVDIADIAFASRLSQIQSISLSGGGTFTYTAGSFAQAAGITSISVGSGSTGNISAVNYTVGVSISGNSGADTITGSAQADTITTGGGNNIISAGAGNDTVTMSAAGADSIVLGAGDDLVAAGSISASDDTLAGGTGTDTLTLSRTASGGTTTFAPASSGNFSGFEVISLGGGLAAAGTVVGAVANYSVTLNNADSTEGTMTIDGTTLQTGVVTDFGADSVLGGTDDTTSFGTLTLTSSSFFGAVSVVSGGGNDVITTGSKADTIDSGAGNDNISAGNGANLVTAGAGNDTVTAGTGNDTISGGDGNDTLSAGDGANSVDGGAGNDSITAGSGNDTILGGAGADTITGGAGTDSLTGGAGNDVFVFSATDSTYANVDVITDLTAGDVIQVNITGVTGSLVQAGASAAITGDAGRAAISALGVATFDSVANFATDTLANKVAAINNAILNKGEYALFTHNGMTYMYVETLGTALPGANNGTASASNGDFSAFVVQLVGVSLPTTTAAFTGGGGITGGAGFGG